jgi:hypothetical protein
MREVNPSNAQNLFLFSVLTIFYAFGCPRESNGILLVGESAYPDWMFLLQGTRAFSEQLAGTIEDGPLAPVFKHGMDRWDARQVQREPTSPIYQHLERLRTLICHKELNEELGNIYTKAISELRKSFLVFECDGRSYDVTDLFVWIFEVANDFLPLLRTPTQEAVVIFAFFCVLLKGLKSRWWLYGWADHLIAKSYNLLDREHQLWIQWPLEELGYVP